MRLEVVMLAGLGVLAGQAWGQAAMKPGLWEVKTIKQVMDGKDMMGEMAKAQAEMQQMMARMSPQERKQMEAMMGGQMGMSMAKPNVIRLCVSPEMAARDESTIAADPDCKPSKVTRSGNKTTFEIDCTSHGQKMNGKGESVVAGDSISTKMDMTTSDARGRHTMQSESQMKFVGADCGGLKPADQLAKEMQGKRK
jgi:hypothetical protein